MPRLYLYGTSIPRSPIDFDDQPRSPNYFSRAGEARPKEGYRLGPKRTGTSTGHRKVKDSLSQSQIVRSKHDKEWNGHFVSSLRNSGDDGVWLHSIDWGRVRILCTSWMDRALAFRLAIPKQPATSSPFRWTSLTGVLALMNYWPFILGWGETNQVQTEIEIMHGLSIAIYIQQKVHHFQQCVLTIVIILPAPHKGPCAAEAIWKQLL